MHILKQPVLTLINPWGHSHRPLINTSPWGQFKATILHIENWLDTITPFYKETNPYNL
jgi:hypothetical protein